MQTLQQTIERLERNVRMFGNEQECAALYYLCDLRDIKNGSPVDRMIMPLAAYNKKILLDDNAV